MPTNVTTDYVIAEKEYTEASTKEAKVRALEKMYSTVPKHKGTEKLRQEIKTKLAKLRSDLDRESVQKSKGYSISIKKEGASTIVLCGPTCSGKSSLINKLCGSRLQVGNYEFTTKDPEVAIMKYKDVKLQLVEIPAITKGYAFSGKGPQFMSIARTANMVLIVTDTPDVGYIFQEFKDAGILLNEKAAADDDKVSVPAMIVQNKIDLPGQDKVYEGLCKYYWLDIARCSVFDPESLERLKDMIWKNLGLIKIFTKEPGKKPRLHEPMTLRKGSTIQDMADNIHKDFVQKFRFARVWGKSARFGSQQVGLSHCLEDDDTVEIHHK